MSTQASERQASVTSGTASIPVAFAPGQPGTQHGRPPGVLFIQAAPIVAVSGVSALSPASIKGWAGSLTLHLFLLSTLALWYFAPPLRGSLRFDTRLAGSPSGVPDGLTLTGGLNTPLTMPENLLESTPDPLIALTPAPLEPAISFRGAAKPSAGGGRANDNPGAGEGDGFGLARFGEGGELIRGVQVKVGDPQFTLIWDSDADLDLHVVEPGGKEIYWEDPKGKQGGELDVDNTKGYGPENIYWLVESDGPGSEQVKGPGPQGGYRWFVVYWGGFGGIPKPTHWKVRIKHDGQVTVINGKFRALNERSRIYTLNVGLPRGSEPSGSTLPPVVP